MTTERPERAPNSAREAAMQSAEAWAEQVAAHCAGLATEVRRLCEDIHDARGEDDAARVVEAEARIVHALTWGLANMYLDSPGRHAAQLIDQP